MNQDAILQLNPFDAFADEAEQNQNTNQQATQIHLRVQQRNGRKCITTVQGLSEQLDLKRMLRTFKKTFSCNGSIKPDRDTDGKVLQMSGDQRHGVKTFLTKEGIVPEDNIIIHGA